MSQSQPETISNSRFTVVSGQAFFEHSDDWRRPVPNLFWLPSEYGAVFRQLRGGGGHARFAFPWRNSQKSAFWRAYCEGTALSQVSAETASRLIVPFRLTPRPAPLVRTDDPHERVFYDVYGYPFGLVAALTVQQPMGASLPLDVWRDRLRALRLNACFAIDLPDGTHRSDQSASDVLTVLLEWFRMEFFAAISHFTASAVPLTIVAVIQGSGVDPAVALSARPDLQQLLHAITAWPVNWEATVPPPLDRACLPVGSANVGAGDALYAATRGRTIWRPALFTYRAPAGARLHTLSCLMHNQVAGLMQAEMLKLYAQDFATLDVSWQAQIPPRQRANVAEQIRRLSRGERTYRSSSIQRLLEDRSTIAQINGLLTDSGLEPIA